MTLADLQDGQEVWCRRGRAGEHDVHWEPWQSAVIGVTRREKPYRGRPKGEIVNLYLQGQHDWTEYDEQDYCPPEGCRGNGLFLAENYYLEIEGLT